MARIRANFFATELTTGIDNTTTTIDLVGGNQFPDVSGGDEAWLVIEPEAVLAEIVKVTAHTSGSTEFTVERGMEDTSASNHAAGAVVVQAVIASDIDEASVSVLDGGTL